MPTPGFPYRRLPGGRRGFVRISSLWDGPDHLLLVRGTRFTEEYRRFAYADIQALIFQRSPRTGSIGLWLLLLLLAFLFGAIAPATLARDSNALRNLYPLEALVASALLARLVICGFFSCRCFLQTAVSREELPSLQTIWTARKTLAVITERVRAAQGTLPEEQQAALLQQAASADPTEPATTAAGIAPQPAPRANSSLSLKLAAGAFVLLGINALQTSRYLDGPRQGVPNSLRLLEIALVVASGGFTLFALLNTRASRSHRQFRLLLIAALLVEGFDVYLSSFLDNLYTLRNGKIDLTVNAARTWHWVVTSDDLLLVLVSLGGLVFLVLNWSTLDQSTPNYRSEPSQA